jgi:hypothetical protein
LARDERLNPAPRRAGPTWRQFPTAQAHAIIACDFLVVETALLQRLYILGERHLALVLGEYVNHGRLTSPHSGEPPGPW